MEPHHWHKSGSKLESCKFTWTIENALYILAEGGERISSSVFGSDNDGKWQLTIWQDPGRFLSVYLTLLLDRNSNLSIPATCSISIMDASNCEKKTAKMPVHYFTKKFYSHYWETAFKMQDLRDNQHLLPNGNLTLLCTVTRPVKCNDTSGMKYNKAAVLVPKCTLPDQFGTLLQDDKYSDMVVVAGGQAIKAHKCILALRSPVFAAMLECPMKESQQNRVVISDCDYEVVKEMLHFIYTGKAPNVGKMAERLLMAADKYALDTLKALCEEALCGTITVKTAMRLLAVAEMYNAKQLKAITYDYIQANLPEVMSSADCKDLVTERAMQLYNR